MATIIAALVAAVVATFGYVITARAKLLEERRKTYAAALAAVCDYQELPYRIRRRPDSSAATRAALGMIISDVQRDLDFHDQLLELDSPKLGLAYRALVEKSRRIGKPHRDEAGSSRCRRKKFFPLNRKKVENQRLTHGKSGKKR